MSGPKAGPDSRDQQPFKVSLSVAVPSPTVTLVEKSFEPPAKVVAHRTSAPEDEFVTVTEVPWIDPSLTKVGVIKNDLPPVGAYVAVTVRLSPSAS